MSNFKKIVHMTTVHPYPDVRIFHKECVSLAQAGYQVVLLTQAETDHISDNVKIVSLPRPKNRIDRMTRILFHAFRLALREDADIYHFHDPELILVGVTLSFLGKKVIYDAHENVVEDIKVKKYLPKRVRNLVAFFIGSLEVLSAKMFDAVIAVTPKIAERFPSKKTFLVCNFPYHHEFYDDASPSYESRDSIVFYAGGINEIRGTKEMIGAVNLLPSGLNTKLLLAGKFEPLQLQERMASHPGWSKVDYWGLVSREKLRKAFAAARVGLVLFHPDNNHLYAYPSKMFEYMCAGIPVIASDFPLWREIVQKEKCGLLVDPLDEQAIANAIQYLLEHPKEAEEMGRNGRNAVLQTYSWGSESKTLLSVYEKVLSIKGTS